MDVVLDVDAVLVADEDEGGDERVELVESAKTLNPARTGALELAILTAAPAPGLMCVRSKWGIGAPATGDTLLVVGVKKWNPDTSRFRAVNVALVLAYSGFGSERT